MFRKNKNKYRKIIFKCNPLMSVFYSKSPFSAASLQSVTLIV